MKKLLTCLVAGLMTMTAMAEWQVLDSPVAAHLRSISYIDSNAIFVAGSDGVILFYDGVTWAEITSGTDKNLSAIAMNTATDGWAAGVEGIILHCVEGVWEVFPSDTNERSFNDIISFAPDDAYFLSYNLLEGSSLHHWDGADMTVMQTFADNMTTMAADGPNNIWVAGGNSLVHHYNGVSWDSSVSSLPESTKIFSITLDQKGTPFITGVRLPSWDVDMILEYSSDSASWQQVWSGYEKRLITFSINDKRGFAMGAAGRIVEYTIFGWQEIMSTPGSVQVNDIIMPSMAEGWAVSDMGKIWFYQQPSINLILNSNEVGAADLFELSVELLNPGPAIDNVMELIFMEAYGSFFFYPLWGEFDFQMIDMPAGFEEVTELFSFNWPTGTGIGQVAFWAALLDSENNILGYDIEDFAWTN